MNMRTRISHELSAAAGDAQHLAVPVTKSGEICGLTQISATTGNAVFSREPLAGACPDFLDKGPRSWRVTLDPWEKLCEVEQ